MSGTVVDDGGGERRRRGDARPTRRRRRVVLLLDLDCFYAQCETVRLGLDRDLPLALLQWNSALAVNYPARKFGVKRGDSFDAIRSKSGGECVAIHLPVLPVGVDGGGAASVASGSTTAESASSSLTAEADFSYSPDVDDADRGGEDDGVGSSSGDGPRGNRDDGGSHPSMESSYEAEFCRPRREREILYETEKNRMRNPREGKASLDRYRLASTRIFSVIRETLIETLGRKNFVLERASIDELYIDATEHCYGSTSGDGEDEQNDGGGNDGDDDNHPDQSNGARPGMAGRGGGRTERGGPDPGDAEEDLFEDTIVHRGGRTFADREGRSNDAAGRCNDDDGDDDDVRVRRALARGSDAALTVRRAVFRELGFTLSAGISTNKMVAKLAASYGKPDGQAVVFPRAIPRMMEETKINKARNLGGKIGKKVMALLPETEDTLGSVARFLSLDNLSSAVGAETGRWVFDACRGRCDEPVRETIGVLPKSITAFKSFGKATYPELEKWTMLLAGDVMKRVEEDNVRNNRLPRLVTVAYTTKPGGKGWLTRSFRLPFPSERDSKSRARRIVRSTREVLEDRGHFPIHRIGIGAADFVVRSKAGIDSFFSSSRGDKSPPRSSSSGNEGGRRVTPADLQVGKSRLEVDIGSFFPTTISGGELSTPETQCGGNNQFKKVDGCGDGVVSLCELKENEESIDTVRSDPRTNYGASVGKIQARSKYTEPTKEHGSSSGKRPAVSEYSETKRRITDEELALKLQESYDMEAGNNGGESSTPETRWGGNNQFKKVGEGADGIVSLSDLRENEESINIVRSDLQTNYVGPAGKTQACSRYSEPTKEHCSSPDKRPAVSEYFEPKQRMTDEELARTLQESYDVEANEYDGSADQPSSQKIMCTLTSTSKDIVMKDEEIATQLQSSYDRENSILSNVEKFGKKSKKRKINFFNK